jgi:LemA protein
MNITLVLIGILIIGVLYILGIYNSLINLKNRIKEAFSSIDIQLKRRADLIPNLVETVKGYAKHEKEVFENVTQARSSMLSATSTNDKLKANDMLTQSLKSVFAIAEAYPELKANENFKDLQRQLEDTEDKVSYSRQFYNSNVLDYNTKIKVVPNVFIANMMGFKEEPFFEANEEERKKVDVKF